MRGQAPTPTATSPGIWPSVDDGPVDCRLIDSIFDLEDETFADGERREKISSLIRHLALPFLQECSSGEGIAEAIENGKLDHALVNKQVRDLVC